MYPRATVGSDGYLQMMTSLPWIGVPAAGCTTEDTKLRSSIIGDAKNCGKKKERKEKKTKLVRKKGQKEPKSKIRNELGISSQ